MNHRVHLCIKGCLTLKLSAEWKTVSCSPLAGSSAVSSSLGGEMGISVSGRCSSLISKGAVAVDAITVPLSVFSFFSPFFFLEVVAEEAVV